MFKLHPNHKITITRGDSAQIKLRLFNKSSIWHRFPKWELRRPVFKGEPALLNGAGELLWKTIQIQATDSEGKPMWEVDSEGHIIYDSEGVPIPVMIDNQVPVYPHDLFHGYKLEDSEGHPTIPWLFHHGELVQFWDFDWPELQPKDFPDRFPWKVPGGYHPLQEEFLRGIFRLTVKDLAGNTVLVKDNDEDFDVIYLDLEDTNLMQPGLYRYQIEWITDPGTDTEERETVQDTAFFEVVNSFRPLVV